MAKVQEPEITLASTTETQEELDHAVSANWREPFDPEVAAKAKEEREKAEAAEAAKKPVGSAPADKRGTAVESEEENDGEVPKGVQKRIDKVTGRAKAAEQRVKDLEARLEAIEKKGGNKPEVKVTPEPKADLEPQKKDFKDPDEWVKAHGRWAARDEARKAASVTATETEDARTAEVFEAHLGRTQEFRAAHPDFDEKVEGSTIPFSEAVAIAIVEADNGPDVAYYLAEHPDELKEIAGQSRARQVMAIGRISASLSTAGSTATTTTTTTKPKTPAPITPSRTGKVATTARSITDENISTDEFIKLRNEQDRAKRRR